MGAFFIEKQLLKSCQRKRNLNDDHFKKYFLLDFYSAHI